VAIAVLPARAQSKNQFGGQDRADAASQMIVLGVQQGISSLPPTSGQAFTYDYNAELGTFVSSEQLGPTVLRSTQTIGANRFSVRVAASYFEIGETFDPIIYRLDVPANSGFPSPTYTELGMEAKANVTLLNFAATYGFTDRIEMTVNVPVSVVQAQAKELYAVRPQNLILPPPDRPLAVVLPAPGQTPQQALQAAKATNQLVIATNSFSSLGFDFNDGTHAGVGRISVGGKAVVYDNDVVAVAFAPEFFCNSPSEAQFAGSNSPAILPRAIGQVKAATHLRLHADVGYDYDFNTSELRRFVWNTGISVPLVNWTFDLGVGGSKFDTSIRWTPTTATGIGPKAPPTYPDGIPGTLTALNPNETELGTNFVDFLFGMKVKLFEGGVLSGAVNVPVTSDGFRADAIGTVAFEYYF
jgi:hypothetical protein